MTYFLHPIFGQVCVNRSYERTPTIRKAPFKWTLPVWGERSKTQRGLSSYFGNAHLDCVVFSVGLPLKSQLYGRLLSLLLNLTHVDLRGSSLLDIAIIISQGCISRLLAPTFLTRELKSEKNTVLSMGGSVRRVVCRCVVVVCVEVCGSVWQCVCGGVCATLCFSRASEIVAELTRCVPCWQL